MTPTRARTLATVGLVGAAVGFVLAHLFDRVVNRFLPVHWTAPAAIALIALALLAWTLHARPRIAQDREEGKPKHPPMNPLVAARTAALAMAASRTGAAVGGFYAGAMLSLLSSWSNAAARERALLSALAVLASMALVAVALWLERICRIKDDPDGSMRPAA